jgi:hypothetical protein
MSDIRLLLRFFLLGALFTYFLPALVLGTGVLDESLRVSWQYSFLMAAAFIGMVVLTFSFAGVSLARREHILGGQSAHDTRAVRRFLIAQAPVLAVALVVAALLASALTGGLSNRSELAFTNINDSFNSTLGSLTGYLLPAAGAIALAEGIVRRNARWLVWGAIAAGLALGSSGTRWYLLLALSPALVVALKHFSGWKVLSIAAVCYAALIGVGTIRNGQEFSFETASKTAVFDMPLVESAYAIEDVGQLENGGAAFVSGFLLYLVPRSWIDKGVDESIWRFNFARANIDIRFDQGNVLPGLIGSLYMYGGEIAVILGAVAIAAFSIVVCRLVSRAGPYALALYSLYLGGLLLQFRNLSMGYWVPFLIAVLAVTIWLFGKEYFVKRR